MSASARPSTTPGDDDDGDYVDESGDDDGQSAMIVTRKSPKTDKVYIFLTFT